MRRDAAIVLLILSAACAAAAWADGPSTSPADSDMDAILATATTAHASTAPAASAPFSQPDQGARDPARQAVLLLSNGEKIRGQFTTTPEQPIRIYDVNTKEYHDIPFNLIQSMEAVVIWERLEKEWKFKESGSDIKEYNGKTYPARETQYTLTLLNGQTLTGSVAAPLYLQSRQGPHLFVLHKRDKGEDGQSLDDLVYIKRVDFGQ